MNKDYIPTIIVTTIVLTLLLVAYAYKSSKMQPAVTEPLDQPAAVTGEQKEMSSDSKDYTVTLKTSEGDITLLLTGTKTPKTVNNFVELAKSGFYNNTIFHRVISGFMIQGGCPDGSGRGGPGYRFQDECRPDLRHSGPGILSMANAGPNTNGSQFFITLVPTPHLDGRHTVFGKVISGMDVGSKIGKTPTGRMDRPVDDIKIKKVTIIR